jgi:hypothetical protein
LCSWSPRRAVRLTAADSGLLADVRQHDSVSSAATTAPTRPAGHQAGRPRHGHQHVERGSERVHGGAAEPAPQQLRRCRRSAPRPRTRRCR